MGHFGGRIGDINKVQLRRVWLVLGQVTTIGRSTSQYSSRPLSLAIPPWVGAMSTCDGFGQHFRRNGEFCIAMRPATTTAGISFSRLKELADNFFQLPVPIRQTLVVC